MQKQQNDMNQEESQGFIITAIRLYEKMEKFNAKNVEEMGHALNEGLGIQSIVTETNDVVKMVRVTFALRNPFKLTSDKEDQWLEKIIDIIGEDFFIIHKGEKNGVEYEFGICNTADTVNKN